jgi:hypothetical protein
MQVITELDYQHLKKLQILEQTLKKSVSELIALAVDEIYTKIAPKTEEQIAYELMQQSGFIGCMDDDENLSENYKKLLELGL